MGASFSKSWQDMSPTVVLMMAAGAEETAPAAGVRTGGLAGDAAWPNPSREVPQIMTTV